MTQEEYDVSLTNLISELTDSGAKIEEVYTCPHARKDQCSCKKPQPYFGNKAIEKYKLNPEKCYVIGDSGKNDMMLAKHLHTKSVLVLTGEGINSLTQSRHLWRDTKPTHIAENNLDAVNKVLTYS